MSVTLLPLNLKRRLLWNQCFSLRANRQAPLKGSGPHWWLLKIIIGIKPYFVTSNGESLVVQNIVRNGSLWSGVVFRERSNFPHIWFGDLKLRTWGLEIKHLKAHNSVWQGCFFFHYYLATSMTNWALKYLHRFDILCICWDTASGKTVLWQLPIVSSIFNRKWKCDVPIQHFVGNNEKKDCLRELENSCYLWQLTAELM